MPSLTSMANQRLRALTWWRKWARKDRVIASVGFAVVVFFFVLLSDEVNAPFDLSTGTTAELVDLTLLHNAKERGALCLDGSLPGYHFKKGFGSGVNKWLLHLEGGGWCSTVSSCSHRKETPLGSSDYMEHQLPFGGILSSDPLQNPDFFNWNKVMIRYCDGASFAGRPESELKNGTKLFFRGQLIWEAVMDKLLSIGMSKAKQALLTGCSAGGLATLIHCDDFQGHLPNDATVKCLSDAGFFLDEKDVSGKRSMGSVYHDVVNLQGVAKSLQKDCIRRTEPYKCFFPQEFITHIKTPVFLVNPAYDFWQIKNVLVPNGSDPHGDWRRCRQSLHNCNSNQMEILHGFRKSLVKALDKFQQVKNGGMFINSCFSHCQTWFTETWHSQDSPRLNNKTIAESVGDWYFNREEVKQIDCPFPCNPTCHNKDFSKGKH